MWNQLPENEGKAFIYASTIHINNKIESNAALIIFCLRNSHVWKKSGKLGGVIDILI